MIPVRFIKWFFINMMMTPFGWIILLLILGLLSGNKYCLLFLVFSGIIFIPIFLLLLFDYLTSNEARKILLYGDPIEEFWDGFR